MDLGLGLKNPSKEATFKEGCLSVRQSVLDKQRIGPAPGPIYNPNLSASSTSKVKCREIKFGSGPSRFEDVPNINRREGTQSHHPGPQTYCPDSIKRAVFTQTNKPKTPSIKFGTGKRDCNTELSTTKLTPSPAEYDPEAIRRGIMFSKKGSPSITFGTAAPIGEKPLPKPGPQTYDPDAIRRGIMSTKSNITTSVKFGPAPSKREEKYSNHQPGPQEYDTESIRRGVDALSTKVRPAAVKFPTGPRTINDLEERERASKPGPCAYVIPSSLGGQVNSRYKSHPSISFGAR